MWKMHNLRLWMIVLSCKLLVLPVKSSTQNEIRYDSYKFIRQDSIKEADQSAPNILMKKSAKAFALKLNEISDSELGTAIIKDVVNKFVYNKHNVQEEMMTMLFERLKSKVSKYLGVLNHSVFLIEDYKQNSKKLCFVNVPCIYISEKGSYDEPFHNSSLDLSNLPLSILNLTEGFTSYPEPSLYRNVHYFISEMEPERLTHVYSDEFKGDKCVLMDDPHFQKVFLKTVSTQVKQIIVLIDNGGSLSDNQFSVAKSLANHIICSLSDEDRVGLFAVSDSVVSALSAYTNHCSVVYNTESNKRQIMTFVEELQRSKGQTNHSLGFGVAFEAIENSMKNESSPVLIIYISRGLMSSIAEAKTVMETISKGQDKVKPNVVINTCVVIDDEKTILYEKRFLSTVAEQNFSKYNIHNAKAEAGVITKGVMVSVNSSSNIGAVVRTLCSTPQQGLASRKPVFSMPQWDVNKKGELVISIAQPTRDKDRNLLGVVGIDVPVQEFAEDFVFFNARMSSYAFLVTINGKALVHPKLKDPVASLYEQPIIIDIANFETTSYFAKARSIIFQNNSGVWKFNKEQVSYRWRHIPESPYIVIGMSGGPSHHSILTPPTSVLPSSIKLVYHRLDLATPSKYLLCRNLGQLSSLDTGSLFLSSWCFQSPYKYISSEGNTSQLNVQSYMAYLKDTTKLLANPGLRPGIRGEIVSAANIIPYWKKLYLDSSLSKYIVRKYIVTGSGAVILYPAGVVSHKLDVLHRSWYLRAIQYPDLVTISPPYVDSAGAGYVVTLSITIGDEPQKFVLGIDFTLGAMFSLMVDSLPSCSSPLETTPGNVKCFMMDDRGYLITHPSVIDPLTKGAADEQHHITHRESLLANDLLNHKGVVTKLVCNDFASSTVQRFYQFNMSIDHVVTNMISGEQCVRYQLARLPGTNVFLGVVNTTCDLVTAFCPCNTIDRHCLNCNRMEQNECECPCECPLERNVCGELEILNSNEPCPRVSEPEMHGLHSVADLLLTTKPCYQPHCDQFFTHKACLGVLGCEWCQLQADGFTPLPSSFCTHQAYCYNGIIGTSGDVTRRPSKGGDGFQGSGMSFGSMGFAMFALASALALMLYCYCKHSNNVQRNNNYLAHEASFHMLAIDKNHHNNIIEEPPTGANTGLVSNAQELSVALLSPTSSLSPYRMSSGCRRPPTGDSDHGYSTMTPHEDTEPPESIPTPTPPLHQTVVPNPHCVIAPVTVHMAMDT